MDMLMWAVHHQGPTLINSARILDAVQRTSLGQRMIEKVGDRLSWISVLIALHDDDDNDDDE